ncbi:MAG: DNA-directed RNA polymerase subunit alpha [Patescibacteria group bacterium]|jgi:DNA-directed RNA polymerase subunit alpha
MIQITFPDKTSIKDLKDNHYQVVIEPFFPGFGVTVGNALRRVLLSSLEGAAVTSFKVEGAQHEFDSVEGVKEDLVEIMLNLKQLRVKSFSEEPVKLILDVKGEKVVTAADIKKNADVEIINSDLVIATITDKNTKFGMEITVEQGRGYVTVEQRDDSKKLEISNVAIDSSFSPVLNVGYKIDNVRVGEMTNYERLTIDMLTDGTIDAKVAISRAAKILEDHFKLFIEEEIPVVSKKKDKDVEEKPKKVTKKVSTKDKEDK